MKKMILLGLSLLVIVLFVVSCAPKEGTVAGEAIKLSKADVAGPTCKVINILDNTGMKFKGVTAAEACKQITRTCVSLINTRSQYIEKTEANPQAIHFFTDISGSDDCNLAILGEVKEDTTIKPVGKTTDEVNQVLCCR